MAHEQSVETVISCIRAGVTEVINNPEDLKQVIETTNRFLRTDDQDAAGEEVTWEDILEVEQMLERHALNSQADGSAPARTSASSAEVEELKAKLKTVLSERDQASGDLAATIANLEKSKRLVEELKAQSGSVGTDTELAERAAELEERERRLRDMSSKLSQQKFEVESQLAELEAQQIEIEEAQKEAGSAGSANISDSELEEERARFNSQRLEFEARIQDLERELVVVKNNASGSEQLEAQILELREKLQDANELVAEKDFIIQQRDREIDTMKSEAELTASNPQVEELTEMKRLLEIERHKLQEKRDHFDAEKRLFEETHDKSQREIQVERRDAEISLREMQNTIKEEQLKLKVEQATLRDEMRQFENARQNFQEDVQELQTKQAELRKMEAYLQQMEESIKEGGHLAQTSLPKPDNAAFEPLQTSTPPTPNLEQSSDETAPSGTDKQASQPQPNAGDGKPDKWGKPDLNKKAGRGPLRIGRRSSF